MPTTAWSARVLRAYIWPVRLCFAPWPWSITSGSSVITSGGPAAGSAPGIASVRIDSRELPQPCRIASGSTRTLACSSGRRVVETSSAVSQLPIWNDTAGCEAGLGDVDDGPDVGDVGPAGGEDGAGVGVDLGEADGPPAGGLEPEVGSPDPREEGGVGELKTILLGVGHRGCRVAVGCSCGHPAVISHW